MSGKLTALSNPKNPLYLYLSNQFFVIVTFIITEHGNSHLHICFSVKIEQRLIPKTNMQNIWRLPVEMLQSELYLGFSPLKLKASY